MRTGFVEQGGVKHPIMGAWAQSFLGPSHKIMPSSVTLCRRSDQGHGFFPVTHSPIAIGDPVDGLANAKAVCSPQEFQKRSDLMNLLDADFRKKSSDIEVKNYTDYYSGATELMKSTTELESFDLTKEPKDMQDAYGTSRFGQAALLARRLISAGTRFVEIEHGEWDHHKNLTKDFEGQAADLDRVYATLIHDLQQRGLLDSTMVVIASEFGRSPSFNGGRNHYPACFTTVLAGGGVKGGFAYSSSDENGGKPANNPTTVGDLHATLGWAFGLPLEHQALGTNGNTYVIGSRGKPALGVFA
jgi:arylsulfatase A-like enzyme